MEIKSTITHRSGQVVDCIYKDVKDISGLEGRKVNAVHGFCFYNDKLVLVYSKRKGRWSMPGGGVEAGETIEEALIREVKEETNMRILEQRLIGFQDIFESEKIVTQTRSVCIVEPYGPFVEDPDDGEITEIKLINPEEYREYVNWGTSGNRIMERAKALKSELLEK